MKANKLVSRSRVENRCADHRHVVEVYCSMNWPVKKAMMISGGRNLYQPVDINSRRVEYLDIGRVVFELKQWQFIH